MIRNLAVGLYKTGKAALTMLGMGIRALPGLCQSINDVATEMERSAKLADAEQRARLYKGRK